MSKFSARYTPKCARLVSKLPSEIKRLVRSTIDALLKYPTVGTELTGELEGYRSIRMRRHRIIYRVNTNKSCIEVYHIGYRRNVYEALRSILSRRQ